MYVYVRSDSEMLWTVGFFDSQGRWEPESDWGTPDEAAERTAWLNGSIAPFNSRQKFVESMRNLADAVRSKV